MSPSYTVAVLSGQGRRPSTSGLGRSVSLPRARTSSKPPGSADAGRGPGPRPASASAPPCRWASVSAVTPAAASSQAAQHPAAHRRVAPRPAAPARQRSAVPSRGLGASSVVGQRRPAASASSRSCAAVRASAAATPPASTSSSSGSTSCRSRTRVNARVGVVRVVPRPPARGRAGGPGGRAAHAEQRPQPRRVPAAHPGERARAGPAAQPEQHGLGLVVEGVAEQHRRVRVRAGGAQRGVAGAPGGGLGPARPGHLDRVHARPRHPSPASSSTVAAARSAEPSCSPWSTTAACTGRPRAPSTRGRGAGPASRRRRSRRPAAARPGRGGQRGQRGPHRPADLDERRVGHGARCSPPHRRHRSRTAAGRRTGGDVRQRRRCSRGPRPSLGGAAPAGHVGRGGARRPGRPARRGSAGSPGAPTPR